MKMPLPRLLVLCTDHIQTDFDRSQVLRDFDVRSVASGSELEAWTATGTFDCAVVAGDLPGLTPVEVLGVIQTQDPELPVVFWDANLRASDAVRLVRAGAYHCVG